MPSSVAHSVAVLAFHPDSGRPLLPNGTLDVAIAGAILADLTAAGRIDIADNQVVVLESSPPGISGIDEALAEITTSKPRSPEEWVWALTKPAALVRTTTVDEAVAQGDIVLDCRRVLGVFGSNRWFPRPHSWVARVSDAVHAALTGAHPSPDATVAMTVAVLDAAGILSKRFPAARRELVDVVKQSTAANDAVAKAMEHITSAALVAVLAATTMTPTPSN